MAKMRSSECGCYILICHKVAANIFCNKICLEMLVFNEENEHQVPTQNIMYKSC